MKKSLFLLSLLAAATSISFSAEAAYDALRPQAIISVSEGASLSISQDADSAAILAEAQEHVTVSDRSAIVKDGLGSLLVDQDTNMQCSLVVREGQMQITDATVNNDPALESPQLTVGGTQASFVLDHATYQQRVNSAYGRGYSNAVCIGGRDGDGSITLQNGSVMSTSHQFIIGFVSLKELPQDTSSVSAHVCGTYAGLEGTDLYRDIHPVEGTFSHTEETANGTRFSTGALTIDASTLNVGTALSTGKAVIKLQNGAKLTDGCREIADAHSAAYGDTTRGKTEISISGGSTWTSNNDVYTSYYGLGNTEITVSGSGSSFNSLRDTYFGWQSDQAFTTVKIQNGAEAVIIDASMGVCDNKTLSDAKVAVVEIDSASSYKGSALRLWSGSSFLNEGTMTLEDGKKNNTFRQDNPDGQPSAPMSYKDVASVMSVNGGRFLNGKTGSADITQLNVSAGTFANHGKAFIDSLSMSGGQFYVNGQTSIGSAEINAGELVFTVGDLVHAASPESFGWDAQVYSQINLADSGGALTLGDGTKFLIEFGGPLLRSELGVTEFTLDLITGINADSLAALTDAKLQSFADNTTFASAEPWNYEISNVYYSKWNSGVLSLHGTLRTVPEPTGTVLILTALSFFAGRRRRKSA